MQLNHNVSVIDCQYNKCNKIEDSPSTIFDIASINNTIINCMHTKHVDCMELLNRKIGSLEKINLTKSDLCKKSLNVGDTDLKLPNVFQ